MNRILKLEEFLAANPADSFIKHALALEYVKQGDDAKALAVFTELLGKEPGYIGSYYHLGKLLERQNKEEQAIEVYLQGMDEAKKAGDLHAAGELRGAWELLTL